MNWAEAFDKLKALAAGQPCLLSCGQWFFNHVVLPEQPGRRWSAYIEGMGHFHGDTPEEALALAEQAIEQRILAEAVTVKGHAVDAERNI